VWHPSLIAEVGKTPGWRRGDMDEHDWAGCLVVLPQVCQHDLPGFWIDEVRGQGARVIEGGELARCQIVEQALGQWDQPSPISDAQLVADFFALGLCYLLTEALSVQMRYGGMLDSGRFESLLVTAARAAVAAETDTAREKLSACFDCLAEAKDHFYPVDAYLIDLVLVAPTTLGRSLVDELQTATAANVLVSGDDLAAMQRQHPESLAALRQAVQQQRVSLVGGEPSDQLPLPLETIDGIVDHLLDGRAAYQKYLGCVPTIYGRRRQGLSLVLPQLLTKCGFEAVLHLSLDDGRLPRSSQNKFRWEGVDGSSLDALGRTPLDAAQPESVLALPLQLGESMDTDHVAALCFAHWPGQTSVWYRDLRRACRFTAALGKFVTLAEFFDQTADADYHETFTPDDYRTTWLQQQAGLAAADGGSDPISRIARRQAALAARGCRETIQAMTALMATAGSITTSEHENVRPQADEQGQGAEMQSALRDFAAALPRSNALPVAGYLVVNPFSFSRHVAVETAQLSHPPRLAGAVREAYQLDDRRQVVVELPPLGYAWIAGDEQRSWAPPQTRLFGDGHLLRNEHLKVQIHPDTGGIQSIHALRHRGNILSQQLALRLPGSSAISAHGVRAGRHDPSYSTMVASELQAIDTGPVTAAITSRGDLRDADGQRIAEFRQTASLMRTTPLLTLDIELQPQALPAGNPWNNYYAARFAWADPYAEVRRGVALGSHITMRQRIEAPHYIELRSGNLRTALLTYGLPYHQRIGSSQLDSLLIVPGETACRFRIGIGVNLARPQTAALDGLTALPVLDTPIVPPPVAEAWLFHLDTTQVVITRCRVLDGDRSAGSVRLRLLEVSGRSVRAGLHAFRDIASARKLDFVENEIARLQPSGNVVMIELSGHECCELELVWQNADQKP
jgi:alpha-mannosidase